ncbi:MAG: Flp family type IVb pilin [Desulfobacteraceae bacterium]
MGRIKEFIQDESGISAVEYTVMLAVLGSGLLAAVLIFYGKLADSFNAYAELLPN